MPKNYTDIFESDYFYHIYNRAVGNDLLFYQERNYLFFLDKLYEYLHPFLNFYAYCLLPNHFHLLVKVKTNRSDKRNDISLRYVISEAFRKFTITYAKAINKQQDRMGSLFMRPLKRVKIDTDIYLKEIIFYIHHNPVHHEINKNFKTYKWSSYQTILSNKPTKISRKQVIDLFDDIENFIYCHKINNNLDNIKNLTVE